MGTLIDFGLVGVLVHQEERVVSFLKHVHIVLYYSALYTTVHWAKDLGFMCIGTVFCFEIVIL